MSKVLVSGVAAALLMVTTPANAFRGGGGGGGGFHEGFHGGGGGGFHDGFRGSGFHEGFRGGAFHEGFHASRPRPLSRARLSWAWCRRRFCARPRAGCCRRSPTLSAPSLLRTAARLFRTATAWIRLRIRRAAVSVLTKSDTRRSGPRYSHRKISSLSFATNPRGRRTESTGTRARYRARPSALPARSAGL